jgi:hypothetical protein
LFTLCNDPFQREAFVDNLLSVSTDIRGKDTVLVALRADFYAHCAHFGELRDLLATVGNCGRCTAQASVTWSSALITHES